MKFAAEWRALATQNVHIEAPMFPGGASSIPSGSEGAVVAQPQGATCRADQASAKATQASD